MTDIVSSPDTLGSIEGARLVRTGEWVVDVYAASGDFSPPKVFKDFRHARDLLRQRHNRVRVQDVNLPLFLVRLDMLKSLLVSGRPERVMRMNGGVNESEEN